MKRESRPVPLKFILLILIILCMALIVLSYFDITPAPVKNAVGYVTAPVQKGVSSAWKWLEDHVSFLRDNKQLSEENAQLKEQVARLTEENRALQRVNDQNRQLSELYKLDNLYQQYPKTAASVIGKDSGNWFETFVIDKGEKDGIAENMNVLANGALVGKVVETGDNWARVRSIIDGSSNVSAMSAETGDYCVVNGSLDGREPASFGEISFSRLTDDNKDTKAGQRVVTSNISDVYLPGLLIGYFTRIDPDEGNMTASGMLSVAADFQHLQNVLVITQLK